MTTPIIACINRAKKEGTSLIIEGSNIIPSLISPSIVDLFLILQICDEKAHWTFLTGKSHKYRHISDDDFNKIRLIQKYILEDAENMDEPQLVIAENSAFNSTLADLAKIMQLLFEGKSDEKYSDEK